MCRWCWETAKMVPTTFPHAFNNWEQRQRGQLYLHTDSSLSGLCPLVRTCFNTFYDRAVCVKHWTLHSVYLPLCLAHARGTHSAVTAIMRGWEFMLLITHEKSIWFLWRTSLEKQSFSCKGSDQFDGIENKAMCCMTDWGIGSILFEFHLV